MNVLPFIQAHLIEVILWTASAALLVWLVLTNATSWRGFISEVGVELSKCAWPWNPQEKGFKRYKELIDSTVVVAVSSLLLAGIVTSSDFILLKVVGFLTRLHI
jgi:preprotein translocase subunit SecE